MHNNFMYRDGHTTIIALTTPTLLVKYVKEIPSLFKWEETVVHNALELKYFFIINYALLALEFKLLHIVLI